MTMLTRLGQALVAVPSAHVVWQKLAKHAPRAVEYARLLLWLLADCFGLFRWRAIRVAASGLGRFVFRLAALAVLFFFIRSAETKEPLPIDWLPFPEPGTAAFLLLGVSLGMGMLMAASYMMYDVARQATEFGRRYNEFCARRFFMLASRLPDDRAPYATELILTGEGLLVARAGQSLGLVSRNVIRTLPSVVGLLGGGTILLVIDPGLTLSVALLAVLSVLLQYPANHGAAKASRRVEAHSSPAARRYRDFIWRLRTRPLRLSIDGAILDRLFDDAEVQGMIESHSDRFRSRELAGFMSKIGGDAILGIAFVLIGLRMLEGNLSWADIGVFVATLRFTLKDFITCAKLPPMVQMFHAGVDRYVSFVTSASKALTPHPAPAHLDVVQVRAPKDSPCADLTLQPGTSVSLAGPVRPQLSVAEILWQAIDLKAVPITVITADSVDDEVCVSEVLGIGQSQRRRAETVAFLDRIKGDVASPRDFGPAWLDRPIGDWSGHGLDGVLAALQLHSALRRRSMAIIAVEADLLEQLGQEAAAVLRDDMAHVILVLLGNDLGRARNLGAQSVMFHDGQRVDGWMPLAELDLAESHLGSRVKEIRKRQLVAAGRSEEEAAAALDDALD